MKKHRGGRGSVGKALVEALEGRQLLSSVALEFAGGAGGVANTGFTGALGAQVGGKAALGGGKLLLTTTAGDLTRNNQDNALGVGVNATTDFRVQARLTSLPFAKNWQNGGIFVGTNQDNYVKLVVGYNGATTLQLGGEAGATFTSAALTNFSFAGVTKLDLRLVGTASTKRVVAQYRVNSDSEAAWVTLGQTTNPNVFSATARAGVVATNFGATPITVGYESFAMTDGATPPVPQPPPPVTPPKGTMAVGPVVNASRLAGNQVETEIAINPKNANNVVIVSQNQNGNNSYSLLISRSFDGGKTWATSALGSGQDKLSGSTPRVDPHLTFDGFGNLYVTYMVAASTSEIRVIVARSSDGGQTFAAQTAVGGQGLGIDYPIIATGPDATDPSKQAVWVAYTDTRARRIKIVAARSSGLGNLSGFSAQGTVSDAGGSFGTLAVGPQGQVVLGWQRSSGGQGPADIVVDVDADGLGAGKTWGVDRKVGSTNVGGFDYIPAQPNRSIDANVGVAFDRSNGPRGGRLYMVYSDEDGNESNDTDIKLRYSDNLGATWSSPIVVNDDNTTRSQFLPAIAVDQSSGNVALVWRDARNSPGNNTSELWGTVSIDGGASVRPNVRIGAMSNQAGANTAGVDDLDFGDYQGVAFANGRFIPVWADNSNSTGNNPNGGGSKLDLYTAVVTVG
jgi:hypothetical protein